MASANVTLRTLALGNADSITGWYAKSFTTSTIKMVIAPKGSSLITSYFGTYAKYDLNGYCIAGVCEDDEIIDAASNYYVIKTVEPYYQLNTLVFYGCALVKRPMQYDRPATSGTWPIEGDPKYRTKVWLDKYILNANLLKDNGATQVSFITAFGFPDYSLSHIFMGKDVDLTFSIGDPVSVPQFNADKTVDYYEERVPITPSCIDKTGITGANLKWQAELELRRLCETYPFGSIRLMDTRRDTTQPLGSSTLYQTEFQLAYRRGP